MLTIEDYLKADTHDLMSSFYFYLVFFVLETLKDMLYIFRPTFGEFGRLFSV